LKQLLQAEDIDEKRWPARVLAGLIDGWKTAPHARAGSREAASLPRQGKKLYTAYQERLKALNAAISATC